MIHSSFHKLLSDALKKDLLFAAYRLPGEQTFRFILQTNETIAEPSKNTFQSLGFIFQGYEIPGCFIQGDLIYSSDQELEVSLPAVSYNRTWKPTGGHEIEKQNYLDSISWCIDQLNQTNLEKVVISRMISREIEKSPAELFMSLSERYSDAMVYLVHLPGNYSWLGASPERLLSRHGDTFKTMALAGTRSSDRDDWTTKEYHEQGVVEKFISDTLEALELNYKKSEVSEKRLSSGLKHLCTEFTLEAEPELLFELANRLHPTPAVCGLPVERAKEVIKKAEKHDREFYTGFLGPVNVENKSDLFVNLRCGSIFGNEFRIFVGGGITKDSEPEAEWKETMQKANTLEAILDMENATKTKIDEHQ